MDSKAEEPAALPSVKMQRGVLLCPACESSDLMLGPSDGTLVCEACEQVCTRSSDQCQRCGAPGTRRTEQVAFPAPGQSPKETKSTFVTSCDACGYTSQGQ